MRLRDCIGKIVTVELLRDICVGTRFELKKGTIDKFLVRDDFVFLSMLEACEGDSFKIINVEDVK